MFAQLNYRQTNTSKFSGDEGQLCSTSLCVILLLFSRYQQSKAVVYQLQNQIRGITGLWITLPGAFVGPPVSPWCGSECWKELKVFTVCAFSCFIFLWFLLLPFPVNSAVAPFRPTHQPISTQTGKQTHRSFASRTVRLRYSPPNEKEHARLKLIMCLEKVKKCKQLSL